MPCVLDGKISGKRTKLEVHGERLQGLCRPGKHKDCSKSFVSTNIYTGISPCSLWLYPTSPSPPSLLGNDIVDCKEHHCTHQLTNNCSESPEHFVLTHHDLCALPYATSPPTPLQGDFAWLNSLQRRPWPEFLLVVWSFGVSNEYWIHYYYFSS